MMTMQQEKPQSPSDYAGRSATTEFEARGQYLFNQLEDNKCKYDPQGVTFIQHPINFKKLAVVEKPLSGLCNACDMDHKTTYYKLEEDYSACYCENYREGSWIFKKVG